MGSLDRLSFDEETCANLQILELIKPSDHNFTDDDLAGILARCPNLEVATFCGVPDLSDRTLVVLATTAAALRTLDISGCKDVTDIGVLQIAAGLTSLESLKMNNLMSLKDPAVSAIASNLARLTQLELTDSPLLTAHSVRDIWFYSRKLCHLNLARCPQLTDKAFPHPWSLDSVVAVSARPHSSVLGSSLTESLAAHDPNHTTPRHRPPTWLEELPPLMLTSRQALKDLVFLNISGCPKLTDVALSGALMYAPRLRHLDISGCASLSPTLEQGTHIAKFFAPHVPATSDADIVALLRATSRITTIDLSYDTRLTDLTLIELSALPHLRHLTLTGLRRLTDAALRVLAEVAPALYDLDIAHCRRLSLDAVHAVLRRIPNLQYLNASGIPSFRRIGVERFSDPPPKGYNEKIQGVFRVYRDQNVAALRTFLDKEIKRMQEAERKHIIFVPRSDDSEDLY